jgi:hypothetical protein
MSTLSTAGRNAACDAVVDLLDVGSTDAAGDLLLRATATTIATIALNNPAYGAASSGVATAAGFPKNATAGATGIIDNYQLRDRDNTVVISGTVGEGSGDISFDNTDINSGQTVTVSSLTHTQPAS